MRQFLLNLLFPNSHNNYRPYLVNNLGLGIIVMIVFISQLSLRAMYKSQQVLGDSTAISTEEIIRLTNEERIKANLAPVNENEKLRLAAEDKLKDMLEFNYWDHYSPSKRAPWQFIIQKGYSYKLAGENLGRDFHSSTKLVEAWMNSEGHRANILKPEFKDIGVAIGNGKIDGENTVLIVQFFAEPAPAGAIVISESDKGEAFALAGAVINREQGNRTWFNIPLTSKTITLVTIFLLITILTIDAVIMTRIHKVKRISGRYWAHMMFLYTLGAISYWVGW